LTDEEWTTPANGSNLFLVENWIGDLSEDGPIKSLWQWHRPEDTPLRIAICGAAGTGKKQLASDLADELEITSINSIARTVYSLGGKLNKKADFMDEFLLLLGHFWEETEYIEFASAGSLIDLVAYVHYLAEQSGDPRAKVLLTSVANVVNRYAQHQYSVLLYLPYKEKPKPDGVRSVDDRFQRRIDELIRHYLVAFDLDFFPIVGTSREKRITALKYMRSFGLLDDR
jgi:nicotinamide riboside kinase